MIRLDRLTRLCALLLGCLCWSVQAYDVIEERAFTKTTLHLPESCKSADFAKTCHGFTSYLVSRFERSMVQRRYEELPPDTPLVMPSESELDLQEVRFDIKILNQLNLASCSAEISQKINGVHYNFIETFNLNLQTKHLVTFKELFEDDELAAMLCARAIEEHYKQYQKPNLQAVVTLTEVMPSNFMIRADGLEFIFAPDLVKNGKNSEHFMVRLEQLAKAFPNVQWFPGFKNPIKPRPKPEPKFNPELPASILAVKRKGIPPPIELNREQIKFIQSMTTKYGDKMLPFEQLSPEEQTQYKLLFKQNETAAPNPMQRSQPNAEQPEEQAE